MGWLHDHRLYSSWQWAGKITAEIFAHPERLLTQAGDQEQAAIIREIFRMRRRRKTLREIASDLNERNAPTANGGKWYAGTVRYILKNNLKANKHEAFRGEGIFCGLHSFDFRLLSCYCVHYHSTKGAVRYENTNPNGENILPIVSRRT